MENKFLLGNKVKDQYLFISVALLAATIAWPMEITNVFAGICLGTFIIHDRFSAVIRGIKSDTLCQIIFFYFIIIILTALREETLSKSIDIVVKRLMLVLPLFFYGLKITSDQRRWIVGIYLVSVTFACLASVGKTLQQWESIDDLYEFSWFLSNHSVISSNYLALYVAFASIILFHSFFTRVILKKPIDILLFIILMLYIAFLGSRTSFFSVVVVGGGYLAFKSLHSRRHIFYSAIFLCVLVIMVFTVPYFKSRVLVLFTVGLEADARYYEILAAKEIFRRNFWAGVGYTGADVELVKGYQTLGFHEGVDNKFNAHNQFIQSALVFGVFGLLVTAGLYFIMFIKIFKRRTFVPLAFCLIFTLCSFTESLLERNKGVIFFAFFSGFMLCAGDETKGRTIADSDAVTPVKV